MKNFIITIITIIAFVSCHHGITENEKVALSKDTTLIALFYGMEMDTVDYHYLGTDSVLDRIEGLQHVEHTAKWYYTPDERCYNASIGLYVDSLFPTKEIEEKIILKLDSLLLEDLSYYSFYMDKDSLARTWNSIKDSRGLIKECELTFNRISCGLTKKGGVRYDKGSDARICAVVHKIYEDSVWVTYIMEESVDFNGSCGCPSSAFYYTYNKDNGDEPGREQLLAGQDTTLVYRMIEESYKKAKKARNRNDVCPILTGKELVNNATGVVKVKEGIMAYYIPYSLGCGAEGEYQLLALGREP